MPKLSGCVKSRGGRLRRLDALGLPFSPIQFPTQRPEPIAVYGYALAPRQPRLVPARRYDFRSEADRRVLLASASVTQTMAHSQLFAALAVT